MNKKITDSYKRRVKEQFQLNRDDRRKNKKKCITLKEHV